MTTLAFVDLETTGLDPNAHETWEVAVIVRGHEIPDYDGVWCWRLRVASLTKASPDSLAISRYYARALPLLEDEGHLARTREADITPRDREAMTADGLVDAVLVSAPQTSGRVPMGPMPRTFAARWIAALLEGAVLIGNNVAFDARFLHVLLHNAGHAAAWQYRVVDVVSLAAGLLRLPLPWRSEDVSRQLGLEPPPGAQRHTAIEDAVWAMRMYDAVLAPETARPVTEAGAVSA